MNKLILLPFVLLFSCASYLNLKQMDSSYSAKYQTPTFSNSKRSLMIITGFFNNEKKDAFDPSYINYSHMVNFSQVHSAVLQDMAKKGLNIESEDSMHNIYELTMKRDSGIIKSFLTNSLPILNTVLLTRCYPAAKCDLLFCNFTNLGLSNFNWKSTDPIFVVIGLETLNKIVEGKNFLRSGIAVIEFSGEGRYIGMQITEYNFMWFNNSNMTKLIENSMNSLLIPLKN